MSNSEFVSGLLVNNEKYAKTFDDGSLPLPPAKQMAVVA